MGLWKPVWESVPFFFSPERNRRYSHWLHLFLEQGGGRRKEIGKRMQTYGLIWFNPGEKCPSQHVRVKTGPVIVTLPSEPRNLVLPLIAGWAGMPEWDLKHRNKCLIYLTQPHCVLEQCFSSFDVVWGAWDLIWMQILTPKVWIEAQDFMFLTSSQVMLLLPVWDHISSTYVLRSQW